jgi:hypothetical protein
VQNYTQDESCTIPGRRRRNNILIFSFKIAQLNGTKLRTKMMIVKRKFRFVQIELILLGEMLKR